MAAAADDDDDDDDDDVFSSAHTTQFVEVGWLYLQHGAGVHSLMHGGSLVSLVSADRRHLTIVIETMVCSLYTCWHKNHTSS